VTETKSCCLGLFRRRECLVPTWRGWLLGLIALVVGMFLFVRTVHPFLAVNKPVPAKLLIVEGWAADHVLEQAARIFTNGGYEQLLVTGGPLEWGAPLSEYKTYAELGAATLIKLGMSTNAVKPVPAPRVRQDRTYVCAVSVKRWLEVHGEKPAACNVLSVGAHARRSRLLFRAALGDSMDVGMINVASWDYDPDHWWRSSSGFRSVTSELIAYFYARTIFRPARNPDFNES
jgi:hypothetical protein